MATNTFNNRTDDCTITCTGNRLIDSNHFIYENDIITLTCNTGYTWNPYETRPRLVLSNSASGNAKTYYPTLSQNDAVATFEIEENWISNTTINLFGKPSAVAAGVPVTYDLTHCAISPNIASYSGIVTFTASADTNYTFSTPPILRYTDINSDIHSVNFTLSNDTYSLDTTSIHSDLLNAVDIEIVASAVLISVPLINNLPNTVTMSPTITTVTFGDTISFSLNVDSSVRLDDVYIQIDTDTYYLTDVNDLYFFTFTDIDINSVVSINADVTAKIAIQYNLSRCTVTPHNTYYNGENDFYFTFYADDNCVFAAAPTVQLTPTHTLTANRISDTEYILYFYLSSIEIELLQAIEINATAILDENAVTNKYGIVSVFKVSKQIMREVMRKRFYTGTISNLQYTDLAQFITSLKWCYIDVESIANSNIILGFSDTQVVAPLILDDDIILDLGTFNIHGIYSNNLDINLVENISVQLPFINTVTLPNVYINKDIHIKYNVNVITGNCKAFIYVVENNTDVLIETFDGNLSIDVPYIFNTGFNKANVNNNGISTNSNLFNVPPQIIVNEFEKTGDNIFITDKYSQIKDEVGYFIVDKINLQSDCLSIEKSMIENLLKSGVFI